MKKDSAKYYPIPKLKGYGISTNGDIKNLETNESVPTFIDNNKKKVEIKGYTYSVGKLSLWTFVGPIEAKVHYKDGDKTNCKCNNLNYQIEIRYDEENSDIMYINGMLFVLAHGYDYRYYISAYGLLFDKNRMELKPHGFGRNDVGCFELCDEYMDESVKSHKVIRNVADLVFETFVKDIEPGHIVWFLDGDVTNNYYINLYLKSYEKIQEEKAEIKRRQKRESDARKREGLSKPRGLKEEEIYEILKRTHEGESQNQIARDLGHSSDVIHNIIHEKTQADITRKLRERYGF